MHHGNLPTLTHTLPHIDLRCVSTEVPPNVICLCLAFDLY